MADLSLTYLAVIKQQASAQEVLTECLLKLTAMLQVASSIDFLDSSKSTIHDFLWALNDLAIQAKEMSERILSSLLRAGHEGNDLTKTAL
jgi:hypothetical protein